jgi:hypothetical protein
MTDRAVVIVSPYFVPSSLAGVHRSRHLAKHLPAFGWTPIVLCVDEAFHEQRLDPGLATLVPSSIEIVKVAALPVALTRPLGFGEISLRAWRPLRRALFRLLGTRPVSAVLITGSPFYPMLLGTEIKRRFGTPVVLDFQDPWVSAWGARQSSFSKAGLSHRLATLLEPLAVASARVITSVSETQNADMAARYPALDVLQMNAIPIGGDVDDFAALRNRTVSTADDLEQGFINISSIGTIWPPAIPATKTLLRAFARLQGAEPALSARIRLNFVGTSANSNDTAGYRVRPLAEAEGVADAVREIPERIPYMRAIAITTCSDAILMIGSDEPHYTASKIYPSLMSGRPYLSLFHKTSSAHTILSATGGGIALAFSNGEELAALEIKIAESLRTLAVAPETLGKADPAAYAPFEARAIAGRFAAIFEEISRQA